MPNNRGYGERKGSESIFCATQRTGPLSLSVLNFQISSSLFRSLKWDEAPWRLSATESIFPANVAQWAFISFRNGTSHSATSNKNMPDINSLTVFMRRPCQGKRLLLPIFINNCATIWISRWSLPWGRRKITKDLLKILSGWVSKRANRGK